LRNQDLSNQFRIDQIEAMIHCLIFASGRWPPLPGRYLIDLRENLGLILMISAWLIFHHKN
jgi:hypothetical protein